MEVILDDQRTIRAIVCVSRQDRTMSPFLALDESRSVETCVHRY